MMRKIVHYGALFALILAVVWSAGLFWFAREVNKKPLDYAVDTEAIIALTGGTERLATAVDLLKQGKGQKLLISGVNRKVDWLLLAQTIDELPSELNDNIVLGHVACNTVGNALESRDWMKKNGFKSLRLVTASYHMPRSYSEFKNIMPDVEIVPYPVFPQTFKHNEWWRWRGSTALILSEYSKFLFVSLRHLLPFKESLFNATEVCQR